MLIMLAEQCRGILGRQTHCFLFCPSFSKTRSTKYTLTVPAAGGVPRPAACCHLEKHSVIFKTMNLGTELPGFRPWFPSYWMCDHGQYNSPCLSFFLCKMVILTIPISYSYFENLQSVLICKVFRRTFADDGVTRVANPFPSQLSASTIILGLWK